MIISLLIKMIMKMMILYYKNLEINVINDAIEKELLTKMLNIKFKKYEIYDDKEDLIIKQTSELLINRYV